MIDRLAPGAVSYSPRHTLPIVRLRCHAEHPDPRHRRRRCDSILADVPGWPRFVELAQRAPDEPDGLMRVRCHRCGAWNVFRMITPSGRVEA